LPRSDANAARQGQRIPLVVPTGVTIRHYSIPIGGTKSEYAVWTYEKPYKAVPALKIIWRFIPGGSMQSKWCPERSVDLPSDQRFCAF
jgi:hypothetical protein